MNFHFDSTVHTRGNDNVASFEPDEFSRQHVPSTQPVGWLVREKNVPCPNTQAQARPHLSLNHRSFDAY